jgi:IS605 OrfB family transposase
MMVSKTIRLRLNPSRRKAEELKHYMSIQLNLINTILARIMIRYIQDCSYNPTMFDLQKELRNDKPSGLKSYFIESVCEKAIESWKSFYRRGCPIDKDTGDYQNILINSKLMFIRTRNAKFVKSKKGKWMVAISHPDASKRGKMIVCPIKGDDYNQIIDDIANGTGIWAGRNQNEFTAELIEDENGELRLHVFVCYDMQEIEYEPKHFIGVDLGIKNFAVVCCVDTHGNMHKPLFFKGGKIWHLIRKLDKKNASRQSKEKDVVSVKDFKNTVSHQISRAIINYAKQFEKPIIVVEDLKNLPKKARGGFERRMHHLWDYRRMIDILEYKAKAEGILFVRVNPKRTSKECPKCGSTVKRNRKICLSTCNNCGYSLNDDLMGAYNIALRAFNKEKNKNSSIPDSGTHLNTSTEIPTKN